MRVYLPDSTGFEIISNEIYQNIAGILQSLKIFVFEGFKSGGPAKCQW